MVVTTMQYTLEGLCCGCCAAKIERELSLLPGVSKAVFDFMSKTLTMELTEGFSSEDIGPQAESIVKKHNSHIKTDEEENERPASKTLYIKGLHCADCARKIEDKVRGIRGVKSANLNFVTEKLNIEAENENMLPAILRQASEYARNIEPEVQITYADVESGEKDRRINLKRWIERLTLGLGALLFALAVFVDFKEPYSLSIYLASYLLIGGKVLVRAGKNISKGQVFDENTLMSIATIGAFAIGENPEGVAVMLFYRIGEAFQSLAVNRSRKSIAALMNIRPDFANLKVGNKVISVPPEEVAVGELILVRAGEKVPLDGFVREGSSALDVSALTGESMPRDVSSGSEILSGSINKNGVLTVEVTKPFAESTISKILELVENASSKKAPTENFITKFARYYTPAVTFAALMLAVVPPLLISGASFDDWIYRALAFLVVSCPCALVISIPLSFFGGIGGASRNGILIKGSNYLEALNKVDTVVFDKTGTLTKGSFKVTKICPAEGWSKEALLHSAAYAEGTSTHPIALSIRKEYGNPIDFERLSEQREIAGQGLSVKLDGKDILIGNARLMEENAIAYTPAKEAGSLVYLASEGIFAGYILISDEIKSDSKMAIRELKKLGVSNTVMLTGDRRAAGEAIAREIGLDSVYTELLPQQKVEILEKIESEKTGTGSLLFAGDGINDAPVLARAQVGVAMGALGSDAAIEAADVVLMTDEPSKLVTAIKIARKTRSIVWQNIIFALGVKALVLVLVAAGTATMWEAVFADVGVALIAILNAMRALKTDGLAPL